MPTPSKFLQDRQRLIISLMEAGCSRREAAAKAGIHHRTLGRWLERGDKAAELAPHSMYARFAQAVREAEAGGPELVALQAKWADPDLRWLRRFLEPEWRPDPLPRASTPATPDPGVAAEVYLSDGTPFTRSPVHEPAERSPA